MKKIFTIFSIAFCFNCVRAQSGCKDPAASNYSPSAVTNDGSCTYTPALQLFNLKVNTIGVGSNSGIEWINGDIYTFGDGGDPNAFYKIDTITGSILQSITVTNYGNQDWEDITADTGFVYIGDFGNNTGTRTDLRILKIKKSQFIGNTGAAVSVTAQAINFSYSDQTNFSSNNNTNYDCESIISVDDSLYIFTKDRGDLKTRVYKLPKTPGTYPVSPYLNFNCNGKITGADYNPISKEIVMIGYMSSNMNSFIWYLNDFPSKNFFAGNKRRVELGNSNYAWQTEGIAFYKETSTTRIFISNEVNGLTAGIWSSDKSKIVNVKDLQSETDKLKVYPNPVFDSFKIESGEVINKIEILTADGRSIFAKKIGQTNATVNLREIIKTNGCYILKIEINGYISFKKIFLTS